MSYTGRNGFMAGLFAPVGARVLDWRRKMSNHVAYALLVYTALHIFVTMGAFRSHGGSLLPYLALIVLVVAIIPAFRHFELVWNRLSDAHAADPALVSLFRRDRNLLWIMAVGLPIVLTGLFRLLDVCIS